MKTISQQTILRAIESLEEQLEMTEDSLNGVDENDTDELESHWEEIEDIKAAIRELRSNVEK